MHQGFECLTIISELACNLHPYGILLDVSTFLNISRAYIGGMLKSFELEHIFLLVFWNFILLLHFRKLVPQPKMVIY